MTAPAAGEEELFSSRLGLILTTIGAAVGTGNIWRFPREAAANGGGAFMIGWLFFLFAWSIPLLIAEFAIGKKTRLGTIGSMRDMAGRNWTWMGMWMTSSSHFAVIADGFLMTRFSSRKASSVAINFLLSMNGFDQLVWCWFEPIVATDKVAMDA